MRRRGFLALAGVTALAGYGVLRSGILDDGIPLLDEGQGLLNPNDEDFSVEGQGECRTPESLESFKTLGGARLGYEIDRTKATYKADPRFIELLEEWAEDWVKLSGLGALTKVWSYGAYVDKCSSWHQAGRAFDFAELEHEGGKVSCRQDKWGEDGGRMRSYWRLAASLHEHFAYTLTCRYNEAHRNHIHVDNGVSGWDRSAFDPGSRVQVQMVQNACRYVFGKDIDLTDSYDDQTKDAVRSVQKSNGISRPLAKADGWREFLRATASA
ncbi:extensin family protein [Tessaracoccus caeni]|uniref:extensin family protein n=1 Tax=Tessaracoccus caeni TaxID=3031239 RepID=UPI0023DC0253|nr:extensin family protein [Tessaracoccus caeni]MDF1488136.1 extensin family protein [Tessaracoccus caeni]